MAILGTIASFLGMFAMYELYDAIDEKQQRRIRNLLSKQNLTPYKVLEALNLINKKVTEIGGPILRKFEDKLNSLTLQLNLGSSSVRQYLQDARKEAEKNLEKERSKQENINTGLSQVEKGLNDWNYQSDSYKSSKAGKQEYNQIIEDLAKVTDKYPDYTKIDKPVRDYKVEEVEEPTKIDRWKGKIKKFFGNAPQSIGPRSLTNNSILKGRNNEKQ